MPDAGDCPAPIDPVAFLVDVDNTLLDNDAIRADILRDFDRAYGAQARDRYWNIQERLFVECGYRDYLGALQVYRDEHPDDMRVLSMGAYLLDYPFADRVYPGALAVLARLRQWGRTLILSDGDVVFQPLKVERAGLGRAADGNVLIYVHKEAALEDIERHCPARHYVVVEDKLRLLAAIKQVWGERVTTVFVRQGSFAQDRGALASLPPADLSVEHIADLLAYDIADLLAATPPSLQSNAMVTP